MKKITTLLFMALRAVGWCYAQYNHKVFGDDYSSSVGIDKISRIIDNPTSTRSRR